MDGSGLPTIELMGHEIPVFVDPMQPQGTITIIPTKAMKKYAPPSLEEYVANYDENHPESDS